MTTEPDDRFKTDYDAVLNEGATPRPEKLVTALTAANKDWCKGITAAPRYFGDTGDQPMRGLSHTSDTPTQRTVTITGVSTFMATHRPSVVHAPHRDTKKAGVGARSRLWARLCRWMA